MKTCSIADCQALYYSKDFCKKHYDANRRHGDPLYVRQMDKDLICIANGCDQKRWSSSLCPKHHRRWKRYGDPNYVNPECNRDGKTKERRADYYRSWASKNKRLQLSFIYARKKRVREATPPWLDLKHMRELYLKCPPGMVLDHVVPLIHPDVCGLNIPDNIQYLTHAENLTKSNKFDGTNSNEGWRKKKAA